MIYRFFHLHTSLSQYILPKVVILLTVDYK